MLGVGSARPAYTVQRCNLNVGSRFPGVPRRNLSSLAPLPFRARDVFASPPLSRELPRQTHCESAVHWSDRRTEKAHKPLNIVFVSTEVAPWSKTGGLGDVVGGLPVELAKRGHKVMSIAPRYDQYSDAWDTSILADIGGETVRYFHTCKQGVDRVFVDHPCFLAKVYGRTGSFLYGRKSGADYADNQQRFLLFNKAALEALRLLPFAPGSNAIVVCNDWHTAMLPVLLKDVMHPRQEFLALKVALCVHNIAFQGRFWRDSFSALGLPESSLARFEFEDGYDRIFTEDEPGNDDDDGPQLRGTPGRRYKKINWLQAGFRTADKLLTVSPHYAAEISSGPAKGVELDGVVAEVGGVEGIVNGMDVMDWDPATDKYLGLPYDIDTLAEGKATAKDSLQAEVGLPVDPSKPLFGFIGRLEEQKGVDILLAALPKLAGLGVQVVILGTGRKMLEAQVKKLNSLYPDMAAGVVQFSTPLAHLITAGADFMLIPSRFEPCGLIQLHAMQYGTVPLVSSTGGLLDTVKDGVTGFVMGEFDPNTLKPEDADAIAAGIKRAADAFGTPAFLEIRRAGIAQDLSWAEPAAKWEAVLEEMTHPSPATSQRKAAVATPVQKIDNPDLAGPPKPKKKVAAPSAQATKQAATTTAATVTGPAAEKGPLPAMGAPAVKSNPATSTGKISRPIADAQKPATLEPSAASVHLNANGALTTSVAKSAATPPPAAKAATAPPAAPASEAAEAVKPEAESSAGSNKKVLAPTDSPAEGVRASLQSHKP